MIDPVSGFEYPEEWVKKCKDSASLDLAKSGFGILTSGGNVLKRGFTTGTTASAAAYAAVASLSGAKIDKSPVLLPCGITADVPSFGRDGLGKSRQYSGDYPDDVTANIFIYAKAERSNSISIETGFGIGRFIRDTPRFKKGESAISFEARKEILNAIRNGCDFAGVEGAFVKLSIPKGKEIGVKTLNPKVGIEGGISLIGTTGFVEPWDDHLTETVIDRIKSSENVVITTGRTGLRYSRLFFPDYESVLAGSKIEQALDASKGCKNVVICGLPGLICRFFNPDTAVSRGFATVDELAASPNGREAVCEEISSAKLRYPWVRIVIINREGNIVGDTK